MGADRVRAAGAMLAAGLFVTATGCSGSTVTAARSAPPATATTTTEVSAASAASFPADFIADSWAVGSSDVVAVYSAANGRLIRKLTVPMPGGGPGAPQLSPDGRTVIFSRGQGTCAQTIDTVPFRGGREQVLIPMTGTGNNAIVPGDPSYSADGRYQIYDTVPCNPSAHPLLHIRDLSTGRELTTPGFLGETGFLGDADSVFLDHDSEVVFAGAGLDVLRAGLDLPWTGLEVLRIPSMASAAYPAPRGCRYQALAGTETELDALMQCGSGDKLSVVAISPRTFTVTSTLIRLGSCLGGETISLAPADPSAMLAETYDACLPPTARGNYRIVKIRAGRAWRVTSGQDAPQAASW
jgi:hypothetical protein